MDQCSNCFNNCGQITSDLCVKYTGIDIPVLGIQSGDSLSYVEQAIIGFLVSTLDGTGIKVGIDINADWFCTTVKQYLPTCGDITIIDISIACIKAICDLQSQVTGLVGDLQDLQTTVLDINGTFNIHCLSNVLSSSGIHAITQELLTEFCTFVTNAPSTYVLLSNLNTLIQTYLNSLSSSNLPGANRAYNKMVPYTAYEYYGALTNYPTSSDSFSTTGQGTGYWERVYLCNGLNNTPDKRGRVAVGVTDGTIGGNTMNAQVNPGLSALNPTYTIKDGTNGSNGIGLNNTHLPPHTHTATVNETPHTHGLSRTYITVQSGSGVTVGSVDTGAATINSSGSLTNLTVTNSFVGGGLLHPNNQPAIGAYYIMYIPN